MIMSAFTINLASVEAFDNQKFAITKAETKRSLKDTFMSWMKITPFNLPAIIFKTGTIATLFYSFRQYSLIYFLIWLLLVIICLKIVVGQLENRDGEAASIVFWAICLNIFTTALPGDAVLEVLGTLPKPAFRLATWLTFTINSLALVLCYYLPTETVRSLHTLDNKSEWMEENLLSVTLTLFFLGLLSCIMIEIYLKWFPEWLDNTPKNKSNTKTPQNNDDENAAETHEMKPKP